MDRELYARLGPAAATAITVAKRHRVSVPALLGQIETVAAALLADDAPGGFVVPELQAACDLLGAHPELADEAWPTCPTAGELRAARAERDAEWQRRRAANKAAKAEAEKAERERLAKARELVAVEVRELGAK